jgi:hypothetical protein
VAYVVHACLSLVVAIPYGGCDRAGKPSPALIVGANIRAARDTVPVGISCRVRRLSSVRAHGLISIALVLPAASRDDARTGRWGD